MGKLKVSLLAICLVFSISCNPSPQGNVAEVDESILDLPSTAYLGQDMPGDRPILFAPGIVSGGENEMSVCISPDGKVLYLFRTAPVFTPRFMLESRWTEKGWTQLHEVSFFDPDRRDSYHFYSPDGKRTYFQFNENRQISHGKVDPQDIFYVEKTDSGWGERVRIDFGDEFVGLEAYPTVSLEHELYFSALYEGRNRDLFFSRFEDEKFSDPERLPPVINSPRGEYHPFIAPDGSYIIYDSAKDGGLGSLDLWINFRAEDGSWGEAVNLGEHVNSEASEMRPYISPDGKYLFFASERRQDIKLPETALGSKELATAFDQPGNGLQDIYWLKADFLWELKKARKSEKELES